MTNEQDVAWSIRAKGGRVQHIVFAPAEKPTDVRTAEDARQIARIQGPICGYEAQSWYLARPREKMLNANHCNRCLAKLQEREAAAK